MMKHRLYIFVSILLLLPACFFNRERTGNTYTFFVQATTNYGIIKSIQDKIKPLINNIIEEELGIKQDKNFPIFFTKKRSAVTVYQIMDLYDNNEDVRGLSYLFLEPSLDSLHKPLVPKDTEISAKVDFFGKVKKGLFGFTTLVALVNDQDEFLTHLNIEMKKAMHYANKEYKRAYDIDLYDIAKSEKYDYLPHISLGHLRTNYIKYLVNDSIKAEKILERIKKRVLQVTLELIAKIPLSQRKLSFDKLVIYDLKRRKYIKERPLE